LKSRFSIGGLRWARSLFAQCLDGSDAFSHWARQPEHQISGWLLVLWDELDDAAHALIVADRAARGGAGTTRADS
jgi:hypothetical protein